MEDCLVKKPALLLRPRNLKFLSNFSAVDSDSLTLIPFGTSSARQAWCSGGLLPPKTKQNRRADLFPRLRHVPLPWAHSAEPAKSRAWHSSQGARATTGCQLSGTDELMKVVAGIFEIWHLPQLVVSTAHYTGIAFAPVSRKARMALTQPL